jgi:hypothetical protein
MNQIVILSEARGLMHSEFNDIDSLHCAFTHL